MVPFIRWVLALLLPWKLGAERSPESLFLNKSFNNIYWLQNHRIPIRFYEAPFCIILNVSVLNVCVWGPFTRSLVADGKRARTKESLQAPIGEDERETSTTFQFYKGNADICHFSSLKEKIESSEEIQNKRRTAVENEEQNLKSKHLSLSMEDWDLLNSYWFRWRNHF